LTFASPLWLVSLVPLAAVVLYLLWGRRPQQPVPFLDLWIGAATGPRPRRRLAAPPLALALAILSVLLAVLGAARPALWDPRAGGPLTIIVDRGATMAAGDRLLRTARAADEELRRWGASTPVELIFVPGGEERTTVGEWQGRTARQPPTALDTTDLLRATIAKSREQAAGPVLVLTDRRPDTDDERIVRVSPPSAVRNAGIVSIAARPSPRPQVMVRIRNDTDSASATLQLSSAGHVNTQPIDLPKRGAGPGDFFVDLPQLGEWVGAGLAVSGDDWPGDNTAWLAGEGVVGRIEPRVPLPPGLRRMVEVYNASRKPAPDAPAVAVVREAALLASGVAGVVVPGAHVGEIALTPGDVQVRPHAVTRQTRWSLDEPVRLAEPPGPDWTVLVAVQGRVAVAVRDNAVRQAWVGLESDQWQRTSEYVVFWGNLFDWLAGGGVRFESHPVGHLQGPWRPLQLAGGNDGAGGKLVAEPGLWPGLYQRVEDGALRAVNAGPVQFQDPAPDDWRPRLSAALSRRRRGAASPLSPAVMLAGVGCAAAATVLWKGRSLTAFSGRRTVRFDPRTASEQRPRPRDDS
jgi:hypothetical protein